MGKYIIRIFLSLLLLLGIVVSAGASEARVEKQQARERWEDVRKRIEDLKMWKLTKALDLTEKLAAQVFPVVHRYDKGRTEVAMALRNDMRTMRQALREGKETGLKDLIARIEQNHKVLKKLDDDEWAELKNILNITQQAKFLLFRNDFDREMRKIIDEARAKNKSHNETGEKP